MQAALPVCWSALLWAPAPPPAGWYMHTRFSDRLLLARPDPALPSRPVWSSFTVLPDNSIQELSCCPALPPWPIPRALVVYGTRPGPGGLATHLQLVSPPGYTSLVRALIFFIFFLWVNPMGVGRASVYNNVSTSRGQWARAGPHNMEHGNTLLAAHRGPNTVGRWNTQTVSSVLDPALWGYGKRLCTQLVVREAADRLTTLIATKRQLIAQPSRPCRPAIWEDDWDAADLTSSGTYGQGKPLVPGTRGTGLGGVWYGRAGGAQ